MGEFQEWLGWCENEFADVDFGDKRLDVRFRKTASILASHPQKSIYTASENWSDAKAAYRLFDNEKVHAEEILGAHQLRLQQRIEGLPVVLAIQDTTTLNYTSHSQTEGLGHISTNWEKHAQGVLMHSALALSPEGVSLGILDLNLWARSKVPSGGRGSLIDYLPVEEKESFKWLSSLRKSFSRISSTTRMVTIGDREADLYDFIVDANRLKTEFVVRANHDRALKSSTFRLWDFMAEQPKAGEYKLEIKSGEREFRKATLMVRFASLTFQPPKRNVGHSLPPVSVEVIWVKEENPPSQEKPLEWMLLTNISIRTFEEALEKIQWYRHRWHIESFHKVLKSGCRVEDCRLETIDRLKRYITLFSIIAWRLYWMTHIGRKNPELTCTEALSPHEWKALYCKIHRTNTPTEIAPTLYQAMRWIAQLGGFKGRKGDGEPGVMSLWRGWQRLTDIADDWLLFQPENTCG